MIDPDIALDPVVGFAFRSRSGRGVEVGPVAARDLDELASPHRRDRFAFRDHEGSENKMPVLHSIPGDVAHGLAGPRTPVDRLVRMTDAHRGVSIGLERLRRKHLGGRTVLATLGAVAELVDENTRTRHV